jgi:hypothetical protein
MHAWHLPKPSTPLIFTTMRFVSCNPITDYRDDEREMLPCAGSKSAVIPGHRWRKEGWLEPSR